MVVSLLSNYVTKFDRQTSHEGMYNNICCHTNSEVVQAFAFSIALYLFTYET